MRGIPMKIIKVCVLIVVAIVAVAVWACCKMAGDCDKEGERDDGDWI